MPVTARVEEERLLKMRAISSGFMLAATGLIAASLVLSTAGCGARTPAQREAAAMERGKKDMRAGDYGQAWIECRVAWQNMRSDPEPQYQLGLAWMGRGTPELAVEAFQKAIQLNPGNEEAQLQLALFKSATAKDELIREAVEVLRARVAKHP